MQTKKVGKLYLHIAIAAVIYLVLKFLIPATNGLTPIGVNVISIFIPILYLWLTVGTDWTCILALALIIFSGALTSGAVYSGSLGSALIFTVIGMMAFSKVLVDTGVIETTVRWAITREIVRNRPYVFIALVLSVCGLISLFMDVSAVALVFIAIITVICDEIGYKKGDAFFTAMMLGVFWISNAFNGGSPLGHALPLIMMNTAAAGGFEISYAQWMSVGIPAAALISAICIVFICFIWKPEASKFCNYDLDAAREKVKPLTKHGIIALVLLAIVVLYWILPTIFPNMLPENIKTLYVTYGSTMPLLIAMCLLCVIHVDGTPVANFREMTSSSTIATLLFIGTVMVLGSAVSSADAGISIWLSTILEPVTSGMSTFALVAVATLGCIILTNFISNTVCMVVFYSLTVPLVAASGTSPIGLIIVLCLTACFASLVPSAAVTAPFFFGNDNITVKNSMKWNIIVILTVWAATAFIIYPFSTLILG